MPAIFGPLAFLRLRPGCPGLVRCDTRLRSKRDTSLKKPTKTEQKHLHRGLGPYMFGAFANLLKRVSVCCDPACCYFWPKLIISFSISICRTSLILSNKYI